MLTLQELSDRAGIQDLLVREASAMDRRDWDAWEAVFTPDAFIDYRANDGTSGAPPEVRAWLAAVLGRFRACQHLSSNCEITLQGDTARVRSMQYIAVDMDDGAAGRVVFSGIWFRDTLHRSAQGWRIAERVEELAWRHNFPPGFTPPEG